MRSHIQKVADENPDPFSHFNEAADYIWKRIVSYQKGIEATRREDGSLLYPHLIHKLEESLECYAIFTGEEFKALRDRLHEECGSRAR